MVIEFRKKPPLPNCLASDTAPHRWSEWKSTEIKVWKAGLGFGQAEAQYHGKVIEQKRTCFTCKKVELDIQG